MQYLVVFEKAPDKTVWARVPDLEGCYSCGQTVEQAKESIREAIALYLEDLSDSGKPAPNPNHIKAELVTI